MEKCCKYIEEFKVSGTWNKRTTLSAAIDGHLGCMKYAHENGCNWYIYTSPYAAIHGHLDCLKYAIENGCPHHILTAKGAARHGHLDCLKYAHENGCPLDKTLISLLTRYGHLDCIKYAIENGCPFDQEIMLSNLNRYSSKIDLDDNWWRTFLFDKDLTSYLNLEILTKDKKRTIKQLQLSSEILFSYVTKDVIKYVLWSYF